MGSLPIELHPHIIQFSERGSLACLARVSHTFFAAACPKLWEELPDAQILLDLLDRSSLREMELVTTHVITSFESLKPSRKLAQFSRWKVYASYVKRVVLNQGKLTREKRKFLLQRAEEAPLLPYLETLLLSSELMDDGDPGLGLLKLNTIDVEHLTMLFLSPHLHTLTMSFAYLEHVNFYIITYRSPRLRNLHLGVPMEHVDSARLARPQEYQALLGHRPGYPTKIERDMGYLANPYDLSESEPGPTSADLDPLGGTESAIVRWGLMSAMTIGGRCLQLVDLTTLTLIDTLISLTIVDPPLELDWDFYAEFPMRFVALRTLTLRRTRPEVAGLLFNCPFLLNTVHHLCWDDPVCIPSHRMEELELRELYVSLMQSLATQANCIQSLRVRCMHSSSPTSSWSLSGMLQPLAGIASLEELHVSAIDVERKSSPLAILPGAGNLQRLTIAYAPVSVAALAQIALACPNLNHLDIQIYLQNSLNICHPNQAFLPALQPITLLLSFQIPGAPGFEIGAESKLARQLGM